MPNKSETWFNFELILKAIWSMKPVWYLNLNFDIGDHTDLTTYSNTESIENKKVCEVIITKVDRKSYF